MPFFSIVVPAYRTATYLKNCLKSLTNQSFKDIEIIVVDDASPDNVRDIALNCSKADSRISVFSHNINKGLHCARKTGVKHARGEYLLFVDSDDELKLNTCEQLHETLIEKPVDILHFGLNAVLEDGQNPKAALGFEQWANTSFGYLEGNDLLRAICLGVDGLKKDWNMDHRAFNRKLLVRAFSYMIDGRLTRAEDSYELYVIASIAKGESSANEIDGYLYHIGRGVTGSAELSSAEFIRSAKNVKTCCEAILTYAVSCSNEFYLECAEGLNAMLFESVANEWFERVPDSEKEQAALWLGEVFGGYEVAGELMRFVRDEAYRLLDERCNYSDLERFVAWKKIAERLAVGENRPSVVLRYREMRETALSHIEDLKNYTRSKAWNAQGVRIFVSTHKDVDLFKSDILQPIQVGAAGADTRFTWALHDDEGDNISDFNPMFCELTGQYWAWKNVEADYYGFCHYRRYFDFSEEAHLENAYGEVMEGFIDEKSQDRYKLNDQSIEGVVRQYDVITTEFKDLRDFPNEGGTPYSHYEDASLLHIEDIDLLLQIIGENEPDYEVDAEHFFRGNKSCFCNMYIMKKDIFHGYCNWLFPLLDEFVERRDMRLYSQEALRTPGHLAERLFNIYYIHQMRIGVGWQTKQLQCVHFEFPESRKPLDPAFDGTAIPVVFAADNNYVPQLTTAITSLVANSSPERLYDIVVLTRNIDSRNGNRMFRGVTQGRKNVSLRIYDVSHIVKNYKLEANAHISTETYYRFLIQDILPDYDKVLYLDSDLVVDSDISELYDIDLGDNLLGAVLDADYLGNLNMNDGLRYKYSKETLHMKDPYSYFQAGVLVLNTYAMKKLHSLEEWLQLASEPYLYNDQDILNSHCEGRVTYLDYSWNVMMDSGRIDLAIKYAPANVFQAYMDSRSNPKIVHFAGGVKPWDDPTCDFAEIFWRYARETPFYEELLTRLTNRQTIGNERLFDEAYVYTVNRHAARSAKRKVADFVFPYSSRRREFMKRCARIMRREG